MGGRLTEWECVCVCARVHPFRSMCVSDSISLPMINPLPLCWAGEFCRFITAGPAGPERITQGREENDHSLSNTQEGCQDSSCHSAHIHTAFPLASPFVTFSFLITPHPPSPFTGLHCGMLTLAGSLLFFLSTMLLLWNRALKCARFILNYSLNIS